MSLDTGTTSPETRFDEGSHLRELDEAVISARRAHEFRPLDDSLQFESLDNLVDVFWKRFKQGGEIRDLEEAISLYRQVSTDPYRIPFDPTPSIIFRSCSSNGLIIKMIRGISMKLFCYRNRPLKSNFRPTPFYLNPSTISHLRCVHDLCRLVKNLI